MPVQAAYRGCPAYVLRAHITTVHGEEEIDIRFPPTTASATPPVAVIKTMTKRTTPASGDIAVLVRMPLSNCIRQ
jgi:hypothetical protein